MKSPRNNKAKARAKAKAALLARYETVDAELSQLSEFLFGNSQIAFPGMNPPIEQRRAQLTTERSQIALDLVRQGIPIPQLAAAPAREKLLRPILNKLGLSNRDWATQAGVDFKTVNGYLKGKIDPHPSTRAKLAKPLDIDANTLPR